jgi:mono/diheme cytochrome c family protein
MNPEITKLIEQYLSGELSAEDKLVFEDRLAKNEKLQEELKFQQTIHEAAKRSAIRQEVINASKSYHFGQNLKWGGLGLGVLAILSLSIWVATVIIGYKKEIPLEELKELTASLAETSPIDLLPSEFFSWAGQDTAMISKEGVLISIPSNAFLLNGKPYTDQAIIQWQEALDGSSIVKSGLSTTSDGKLLETQGMFSFSATTPEGKQLTINPKVGVYVQVPVDEYKEGMMLFDGQQDKNGMINWVKPRALEKIPVPVPMDQLDFYPPGYEDKLNELKARKDKKYRDSLYLSFEEQGSSSTFNSVEKEWDGKELFTQKCAVCHMADKNTTGPKLRNVRAKWANGGAQSGSVYSWVRDWQNTARKDPYAAEVTKWSPVGHVDYPELSNAQIDAVFDYIDGNKSVNPQNNFSKWNDKIQWSFSVEYLPNNEANIIGTAKLKDDWHIFSVDHDPSKADFTGIPTSFILPSMYDVQPSAQLKDGKKPLTVKNELGTSVYFENEAIFKQRVKLFTKSPIKYKFQYSFQICNKDGCIFPPDQTATVWLNGSASEAAAEEVIEPSYIPPSSVLGFWNKKFNNTILATREFESRMKSVHKTCDKKVLAVYTKNLSSPLHELDRKVVAMGHPEFEQFAAENVGTLNPNDPHVKGLQSFYEQAISSLKAEEKRNREKEQKRRNDWDQDVSKERTKESARTSQRDSEVFVEEYNLNHKNVRKQLGRTLGAKIYGTRPVSNIDKFVLETTLARKTGEFYDKETGKTARIQYNDFSFTVSNAKEYNQVFAYLFPDKLNSYHRLNGQNGTFNFPLNDAIIYDLAIVAISEEGYSYTQRLTVKGGNLGEIKLDRISESKLDASVKLLNSKRGVDSFSVQDELKWLNKEQKNYLEQRKRANEQLFRSKVRQIVYPCWSDGTIPVSDSIVHISM